MGLGPLIVILFMVLITAANYLRYRDVLYPPVLQAGVWTAVLIVYALNQDMLIPLSPLLYGIIVGGTILFSAGSYLSTRTFRPRMAPLAPVHFKSKPWYDAILFWIPVLGLVPYLYTAYSLGLEGPFDSFHMNLRLAVTEVEDQTGGGAYGRLAYLLPISFASAGIFTLLGRYRERRWQYATVVATAGMYAFFFSGRTYLMFLVIMLAGLLIVTRRVSPVKTLAIVLGSSVVLFALLGAMVGKGETGSDLGETVQNLWTVLLTYVLGALPAFDLYVQSQFDLAWGENTFRTFYAVAANVGFDVPLRPLVQEYEFVPFPTNVYSVYQPYFSDFSFAGISFAALLFGYAHGYLYRRADRGHLLSIVLFAMFLYPLFMQFFQDQYFSLLSLWAQYGLLLFVYFYRVNLSPTK